ncbi:MAG TPA: ATP-binding protein [Gemmata sp.]|jgi:predicted kinase|nr:ATP-binding protein [Gemmata sp.]
MNDLAILIGLLASGKTSFYQSHLAATHVHVSKDLIRNNRNPARRQAKLITEALAAGRSVAVDNTNATVELRQELIDLGRLHDCTVTGYYVGAKLEDCLTRNASRIEKYRVLEVGLFSVLKVLVRPSYMEGFDRLFYVTLRIDGAFSVQPWEEERPSNPSDQHKKAFDE